MNTYKLVFLLLIMMSFESCASRKPDLERIYKLTSAETQHPPVIFIHGILGSKIRSLKENEEVWPGGLFKMLFGSHSDLKLSINAKTLEPDFSEQEPYALFEEYGDENFYKAILKTLHDYGQYEIVKSKNKASKDVKRRVYVFLYDWRKDLWTADI